MAAPPVTSAGRRTAAKQSAAPLPAEEGSPIMRADAKPINYCPKCGELYTGTAHTCWPWRCPR